MANKQISLDDLPELDDGWWKSVLADSAEWKEPKGITRVNNEKATVGKGLDWANAKDIFRQDKIIEFVVTGFNKGGLLVDNDDMHAFIPCSHLIGLSQQMSKEEREICLSTYIGKKLSLKIIECIPDEGRLVLSERAAQTESGRRTELLNSLQSGQKVCGEVTNITEFGAFVDMGGIEGLIHLSELSWGRVHHPSQILTVGQRLEVLVMEIIPEKWRIALSLKRLVANPWENADIKYYKNNIVPVVITSLTPYGAFACVEDGLEGLIHTSEIPMPPNTTVNDVLRPGQKVKARIVKVDISRQRLSLSLILDQKKGLNAR
jgi:small subunit ribosomal protein S1